MRVAVPLLAVLLCLAPFSRADELRLKDGTKVTGKIVGFEDNSFRVETSYGYALVRKDQVASITVTDDAKKLAAASKSAAAPADKSHPTAEELASLKTSTSETKAANAAVGARLSSRPERKDAPGADGTAADTTNGVAGAANQPSGSNEKASHTEPAGSAAPSAALAESTAHDVLPAAVPHAARTSRKAAIASATTKPALTGSSAPPGGPAIAGSSAAATAQAASAPPAPPQPEPIREQVIGNSYINDTYGFHMYKPPDWEVIADAPKMLPGSIVGMGTSDQTTYLIIAQESLVGSLEAQWTPTERRLQSTVENYRPLGAKRIVVSGLPAIQSRFRGSLDNHDWSGSVTLIARDNQLFTIFGMTSADSDLVQIQENVIARTVASLQFGKPPLAGKSR